MARVLIIEDNPVNMKLAAVLLQNAGYEVLQASEAEAALRILASDQRVDLLFTDVVLPGKSGRVIADTAAKDRVAANHHRGINLELQAGASVI